MAEPTLNPDMNTGHCCEETDIRACYLELFYAVLFHPVSTFKSIAADVHGTQGDNRLLFFSLISVVLISTIAPLVQLAAVGGNVSMLVLTLPLSAISGLLVWGIMGLIIGLLAYAFTGEAKIRTFLTLSGLATLPWILMGPICLLKVGLGGPGLVLSVLLALVVWLWSILLFALAVTQTYRMTAERVLIVLAAPFAMSMVLLAWIVGFVENIRQLGPH